jgi:hypothetical protein
MESLKKYKKRAGVESFREDLDIADFLLFKPPLEE